MSERLLKRAGRWDEITPETAGWKYLSMRLLEMPAGAKHSGTTGDEELCFVVVQGSGRASVGGNTWELPGRASVFDGMPWALYLPPGAEYRFRAEGDRTLTLAVAGAVAEERHPARCIAPSDVEVEVRGAGSATRQINHILPSEAPAHRLHVVEVFTPSGNWSSYPPHKHDEDGGEESVLEEVYYFRVSPPDGFGLQRLYSPRHGLDLTERVGDGDLLQVPYGYHMSAAPHGFDLYYLNGLAGDRRSLAASDDPRYAWIRASWEGAVPDPRVPMVGRPA
ncbi:MAG TPA: 5-deoxy-glucuronate isomerase [Actinomycetota bacterium]